MTVFKRKDIIYFIPRFGDNSVVGLETISEEIAVSRIVMFIDAEVNLRSKRLCSIMGFATKPDSLIAVCPSLLPYGTDGEWFSHGLRRISGAIETSGQLPEKVGKMLLVS